MYPLNKALFISLHNTKVTKSKSISSNYKLKQSFKISNKFIWENAIKQINIKTNYIKMPKNQHFQNRLQQKIGSFAYFI
jgi:hypothetical protein